MQQWTEKCNKSQFTSYINRKSDTSYMLSEWIQETTEKDEASPSGARATQPPVHHIDLEGGSPHKMISYRQREASRITEI